MTPGALTLPIYGTDFKTLPTLSMFPLVLRKQSQCLFSAFEISGRIIEFLINSQLKLQLYTGLQDMEKSTKSNTEFKGGKQRRNTTL